MKQLELEHFHIENYNLGAIYCRKTLEKGGVSIFVHKNLKFTKINLEDYCRDQDLEACALKLDSTFSNICIFRLCQQTQTLNLLVVVHGQCTMGCAADESGMEGGFSAH
jgi:hypothetical protein